MSESLQSIIFLYQWRRDVILERLRSRGYPKELDSQVKDLIRKFRESSRNKENTYSLDEVVHELEELKKNWQQRRSKKRKGGSNAGLATDK